MKNCITSALFVGLIISTSLQAQTLLKDIRTGFDGSSPILQGSQIFNNHLYFLANDGTSTGIYRTDATGAGTVKIAGGLSDGGLIPALIWGELQGNLIFSAYDGANGTKLFKTNGDVGNFSIVADINTNTSTIDHIVSLGKMNNEIYFWGDDGIHGIELWKTDGTANGTVLVKDINPGPAGSANVFVTLMSIEFNGELYFTAGTDAEGNELWKTDGTTNGTVLVKDIETNNTFGVGFGSNPHYFCVYNNKLYFSAFESVQGRELYVTDGTTNGTMLFKDCAPGSSDPENLIVYNNNLYFVAQKQSGGRDIWKSDGTVNGTNLLIPGNTDYPDVKELTLFNNRLYYVASTVTYGREIWSTNGSPSGTSLAIDCRTGMSSSDPEGLKVHDGFLYFIAYDNNDYTQIHKSSGNTWNTFRMTDFNTLAIDTYEPLQGLGDCIVYIAYEDATGDEPYVTCNTIGQAVSVEEQAPVITGVFPNPASDMLTVSLQQTGMMQADLLDIDGRKMAALYSGNHQGGNLTLSLPAGIPAGVYLLHVYHTGFSTYHKIIIH